MRLIVTLQAYLEQLSGQRRFESAAIGGVALVAAALLQITQPPIFETVSLSLFDAYQRAKPREYTPMPVRIIDIDEESLDRFGQWPWPRTQIAALVERLMEAGAAAIAFDIVFAEPDRTSPAKIAEILASNPEATESYESIVGLKDHDEVLAEIFERAPVVAGVILNHSPSTEATPFQTKSGVAYGGSDPRPRLKAYRGVIGNLQNLQKAATGAGNISIVGDNDRIVRRLQLVSRIGDQILPALSLEALRVALGQSSLTVRMSDASGEVFLGGAAEVTALKVGPFEAPTNESGEMWLHFTEHQPQRSIPAWRFLTTGEEHDAPIDDIQGFIVFVGTSAAGLRDIIATPMRPYEAGVQVHAQAVEQIMTGSFLNRPGWAAGAELAILFAAGLALVASLPTIGAIWGAVLAFALMLTVCLGSWYAFAAQTTLLNPIYIAVGILAVYISLTGWRFFRSERDRAAVRGAFNRYLSPAMVEQIAADPSKLALGGEMRDITLLFSDIRGFTAMSEHMDPQELTNLLNRFMTPMTGALLDHDATIDKYIGDAIMAFWNAPIDQRDHETLAARAALDMLRELEDANEEIKSESQFLSASPDGLRMGVGVNTGPCCVGNMGSDQRFAYSAIGDAVNLASRLEGLTKAYGVDIIMGESTAKALEGFALIEIDLIQVVGRTQPERIFALLGDETFAAANGYPEFLALHNKALAAYRAQTWPDAITIFARAKEAAPSTPDLNKLYAVYLERIDDYEGRLPMLDWDGVFVATKK
jgi:adenylate cyclase